MRTRTWTRMYVPRPWMPQMGSRGPPNMAQGPGGLEHRGNGASRCAQAKPKLEEAGFLGHPVTIKYPATTRAKAWEGGARSVALETHHKFTSYAVTGSPRTESNRSS